MSSLEPEPFQITPPLLNSSNPWATSAEDLKALYACPYTGAVTIRTSLWSGFSQASSTHQYTFFSSTTGHATSEVDTVSHAEGRGEVKPDEGCSLNTLGYSPVSFEEYVKILTQMNDAGTLRPEKPFIVSVTGTAEDVASCYTFLSKTLSERESGNLRVMMEINLSCPNILDKPPPAYDPKALKEYILAIGEAKRQSAASRKPQLHVGIKTPPCTYTGQFIGLIDALDMDECPISFITATNTLGSCLILNEDGNPALGSVSGEGIGGMAGDALHPLALGNVKTIRNMLDASTNPDICKIAIIGIGGVSDAAGYNRMVGVGAAAVGVGTALGREGVDVFRKITEGLAK